MFADSPTLVDGILTAKTTWTAADSSFEIVGSIQIPQNIIVTIEPGVTVTKTTGGAMFLINGYLVAHGTAENKITFNGGGVLTFLEPTTPSLKASPI